MVVRRTALKLRAISMHIYRLAVKMAGRVYTVIVWHGVPRKLRAAVGRKLWLTILKYISDLKARVKNRK